MRKDTQIKIEDALKTILKYTDWVILVPSETQGGVEIYIETALDDDSKRAIVISTAKLLATEIKAMNTLVDDAMEIIDRSS